MLQVNLNNSFVGMCVHVPVIMSCNSTCSLLGFTLSHARVWIVSHDMNGTDMGHGGEFNYVHTGLMWEWTESWIHLKIQLILKLFKCNAD